MLSQYLDDKTANGINTADLDRELINFASSPFTSSVCYFISVSSEVSPALKEARKSITGQLLSLIGDLEKTFPPNPDTDISGIEEIYG
jgi:hypothetical protein